MYFVSKIVLTNCEKKKVLKFEAEGREFAKKIEINRSIDLMIMDILIYSSPMSFEQ